MPTFRRTLANYVAPPCYANGAVGATWGHVPFDIDLLALGAHFFTISAGGPAALTFQPTINEAAVGVPVTVGHGQGVLSYFDEPLLLPKVTEANVDGASRFNVAVSNPLEDAALATLAWAPVQTTDVGKEIYGLGSVVLANPQTVGRFAAPAYWFGHPGIWSHPGTPCDIFASPFELTDAGSSLTPGEAAGVAAVPWARPGTFQDFLLVLHAAPAGNYTFEFRVNGVAAITLACTSGTQRVWAPTGATAIFVNRLDRISWAHTAGSGSALDGELLWSFRPGFEPETLGMGESGGEF